MPSAVKKKPTARSPAVQSLPGRPARPVVHPDINVNGVPIPREKLRLSHDFLVQLIGFETESEYRARLEASDDPEQKAKAAAGFGDECLPGSVELFGEKVRCWNNLDNRPFDPPTAEKYCQDGGDRQWAGSSMVGNADEEFALEGGGTVTLPRFTVNGETIIVGRTGKTESGQHRILGFILLVRRWRDDPSRYPLWTEEPWMESLVVFGVSEDPTVVRTLDNVRPRTTADTVYTSDVFKWNPDGTETGQRQRRDLSKMLDAAVDLLWKRTGAQFSGRFQTHAASDDFIKRHERIKDAVRFVFDAQEGLLEPEGKSTYRGISLLQLSPGQTAAALWLMSAAKSDVARYAGDRSEKALDLSLWTRAETFVRRLAACKDREMKAVKAALGALKSIDDGLGGRSSEKLAVLAAAWTRFLKDEEIDEQHLALSYGVGRGGNPVLLDPPTFGGVDLGPDPSPPEHVSEREAELAKAEARARKAGEALDVVAGGKGKGGVAAKTPAGAVEALRAEHPNAILLFADPAGDYNAYGEDAETLGRELNTDLRKGPGGAPLVVVPRAQYETVVKQLMDDGYKLKTVAMTDGVPTVTDVRPRTRAAATKVEPAPGPAPAKANGTATAAKPKPAVGRPGGNKKPALRGGINS